jgi:hypothetical protein
VRSYLYKNQNRGPCFHCHGNECVLNFIRIKKASPFAFLATEHKFDFAAALAFAPRATGKRQKATGNRSKNKTKSSAAIGCSFKMQLQKGQQETC